MHVVDEFIDKDFFDLLEDKIKIKSEDLFGLADEVKDADFSDENTIHYLIRQLSSLANVPVSNELENAIIDSVIQQVKQLLDDSVEKEIMENDEG
ncbi:stage VI sporulation protein F [Bacillus sp. P2(2020)]|uniref:Stage VI sporulation protein F n=1 Tax=Calidifontibacillus erzurumensis TaxID=2741433 RepID=A0A8J8GIE3_9BACI|nr:stage VI sporulation protein F [Calidifontibacillus erzurumensis]